MSYLPIKHREPRRKWPDPPRIQSLQWQMCQQSCYSFISTASSKFRFGSRLEVKSKTEPFRALWRKQCQMYERHRNPKHNCELKDQKNWKTKICVTRRNPLIHKDLLWWIWITAMGQIRVWEHIFCRSIYICNIKWFWMYFITILLLQLLMLREGLAVGR